MPELQRLADDYRARGVELVTVILNTPPGRAMATARRLGISAPILRGDDALRRDFKVSVYPWTIILDRKGKPVVAFRGGHSRNDFERAVTKYL